MHHSYREKRGGHLDQRKRNKDVIYMNNDENPHALMAPWIKSSPKAVIVRQPLGQRTLSRS